MYNHVLEHQAVLKAGARRARQVALHGEAQGRLLGMRYRRVLHIQDMQGNPIRGVHGYSRACPVWAA